MMENRPILTVEIRLPELPVLTPGAARRIGGFYRLQARAYLRYCQKTLLPRAAEVFRSTDERLFVPCTAVLTGQVTFCSGNILSLRTDSRECIGAPPELLRRGDTWDIAAGMPLPPQRFFAAGTALRPLLLRQAEQEILRQEDAGIARYHDSWQKLLRRTFRRENYYLTEQGFAYYWPMHAIAPRAEGIPTFLIPFGQDGCLQAEEIPTPVRKGRSRDLRN